MLVMAHLEQHITSEMAIEWVCSPYLYIRSFGALLNINFRFHFSVPVSWASSSACVPGAQKPKRIISLWRWIPQHFGFYTQPPAHKGLKCYNFSIKEGGKRREREQWFFAKILPFRWEGDMAHPLHVTFFSIVEQNVHSPMFALPMTTGLYSQDGWWGVGICALKTALLLVLLDS